MLWQAAGLTAGASNTTAASNNTGVLANSGKVAVEGGLSTWSGVGQFATNQALQNGTSAVLNKALGQDGSLGDALTSTLANTFAAAGFNWVGDFSQNNQINNGSLTKIGLHAIMGGLAAEAAGGDFKSGALVAGANEALIDTLASQYDSMTHDQRSGLLTMNSQVLGVLVASMAGGDEKDMQTGAWVAGNATNYNHDLHRPNAESFAEAVLNACSARPQQCAVDPDSVTHDDLMQTLEVMAAHGEGFNDLNPNAVALVNQYYNNDLYRDRLEADLFQLTESEQSRLQTEQVAELVMAGAGLGTAAVKGGPGIVSWVKGLFARKSTVSFSEAKVVLESAQLPYKGSTVIGHALSKHAGRNPEVWGQTTGAMSTWNSQAMSHLREIVRAPGEFKAVTTNNGLTFMEKRLLDGRGIRLNMDGTFKGFVD